MKWFTNRRKEYVARTFLDLGKVVMGVLVINQFVTKEPPRISTMIAGALISSIFFLMALAIDDANT